MKTALLFALMSGWLVLGAMPAAFGAEASPPARPAVEGKELAAVDQFLGLSDEELDQLQRVLARIRAMSPKERAALRAEVERYCLLPEEQRQRMRQGWMGMPREIQDAWREMMQGVTPERHAEIQGKLQAMEPDERIAYRRRLVEEYLKNKAAKK